MTSTLIVLTPGVRADPNADVPDHEHADDEVIVIEEEVPYTPVAERSVRDRDLRMRPRPRPADLLRVVPGIFVNQHAGGGKANQYFLRGFDADHGTDIALSVDGVPANMVSHAHGQGYADLNWVIPEMIERLDIAKGPYSANRGDFATAGAIDMVARDHVTRSSVAFGGGRFDTARLLAMVGSRDESWRSVGALEGYFTNGPFDQGEGYLRYNAHAKTTRDLGAHGSLSLAATSYAGRWDASGQIPERAVSAGTISRLGSLDPTDGGQSDRHSVYGRYQYSAHNNSHLDVAVYLVRYRMDLYSNFTFFAEDEALGDQIHQNDVRTFGGARARYRSRTKLGAIPVVTSAGLTARIDNIGNRLHRTRARERLMTRLDADITQASAGLHAQLDVAWRKWLRTVTGVRVDGYSFDVRDRLTPSDSTRNAAMVSPKASLVLTPRRRLNIYLNAGTGFHSNDARGAVNGGTPLVRAIGYELGARTRIADRLDLAGSLWLLDLDSEIVWVGDAGGTEPRGRSRRYGVELETRLALRPWLVTDADLTLSRARFRDLPAGADRIPLAPRLTLTSGITAAHPDGYFGRLGVRAISDRPLTEDQSLVASGFTLMDVTAGYRTSRYQIMLSIDNLLNAAWREAQFATVSRLPGDPSTAMPPPSNACPAGTNLATNEGGGFAGCEDVHFTAGAPFNLMLTTRLFF